MRLKISLLFSVLLPFIEPCSATRPLREVVHSDLYRNVAFPVPPEDLLQKIQACSDDYETKILGNIHKLAVALMRDLLTFLEKDALSFEEIRTKIDTGGYKTRPDKGVAGISFVFIIFRGGPSIKYNANSPIRRTHQSQTFGIFPTQP